ncbi:MAG: TlpA disulfide reductase family protein [Thermoanaerobaculia bacterium]
MTCRVSARRLSTALALLALASAGLFAQGDLRLQGLGGGELREAGFQQGAHIVVFWTTWSPRGRDIVERVNALADGWGDRAQVITVNFQEDAADVRAFLQDKGRFKVPVFLDTDGALSKKYHVNSAPWLLVIKDGRTAYSEKLPADPSVLSQVLQ